jgi:hypothetical protein
MTVLEVAVAVALGILVILGFLIAMIILECQKK